MHRQHFIKAEKKETDVQLIKEGMKNLSLKEVAWYAGQFIGVSVLCFMAYILTVFAFVW